jgi:DNA-binding response OmpR family regulator
MARNRILLVDDDPVVRFAVRDFLESQGMQVTEAESVQKAEEKLRSATPDAAIVDFHSLTATGWNCCSTSRT